MNIIFEDIFFITLNSPDWEEFDLVDKILYFKLMKYSSDIYDKMKKKNVEKAIDKAKNKIIKESKNDQKS